MADLLATGAAWLAMQMKAHASKSIEYRRGAQKVTLSATLGKTAFMVEQQDGFFERVESRDYLIAPADLDFGSGLALPANGDIIAETIGGTVYLYDVYSPNSEQPYKFCDPGRNALRVHTKYYKMETVSE